MSEPKLPVVEGKQTNWPDKPVCPVCGENKVFEPHSFAVLNAGALLMNREEGSGEMSDDLDGYLTMYWHGAHQEDNGQGVDPEIGCAVDIIQDAQGGQGTLYFCSTQCLRTFLNYCVDELEQRIKKERDGLQQENA